MNKSENKTNTFNIIKKSVLLCLQYNKLESLGMGTIMLLASFSFVLNIIMMKVFFQGIYDFTDGIISFNKITIIILLYGLVLMINRFFNLYSNLLTEVHKRNVVGNLFEKTNKKAGRISVLAYENPKYLDNIKRANDGIDSCFHIYELTKDIFFFYIPYEVFIAFYLYSLNPYLAYSMFFIIVPPILAQFLRVKFFTQLADKQGPLKREYEYYEKCISDREYFKETRLLGGYLFLKKLYLTSIKKLYDETWKTNKKAFKVDLLTNAITLGGYIGITLLAINLTLQSKINIAEFATVFASVELMVGIASEVVEYRIKRLAERIGYARNLIDFLNIEEIGGNEISINSAPEIKLENVSFSYPNAVKPSLNNVSLTIKAGETVAIVGENGAGKSTIAKIVMGIYKPTSGKVYMNNLDLSNYSPKSVYKNISAVFQKFQHYKMTLNDNVQISELHENSNEIDENIQNKIVKAVEKTDFNINKETFPDGFDTMLSREFDGIDLSGGQWQSIAIARSFYKNHNMIVLDEPTAAIDPVMETKIYEKFADISKGKTSIVVTHRLGSAKIADRIIVMDNGEIAEIGTHDELIANNGKYAEMFNSQSKWYDDEKVVL